MVLKPIVQKPLQGFTFCFGPGMQDGASQRRMAEKMRTTGGSMIQRPSFPFSPTSASSTLIILVSTPHRPYPYTHRIPAGFQSNADADPEAGADVDWADLDAVVERFALYDPGRTDVRVMRKEWVDEVLASGLAAGEDEWALRMYRVIGARAAPSRYPAKIAPVNHSPSVKLPVLGDADHSSSSRSGDARPGKRSAATAMDDDDDEEEERKPVQTRSGRTSRPPRRPLSLSTPTSSNRSPTYSSSPSPPPPLPLRPSPPGSFASVVGLPGSNSSPEERLVFQAKYGAPRRFPDPKERLEWLVQTLALYPELKGAQNYKWYLMSNEHYSFEHLSRFFHKHKPVIEREIIQRRARAEAGTEMTSSKESEEGTMPVEPPQSKDDSIDLQRAVDVAPTLSE